ncbi:type VI secretion system baseplate subunit TssF [Alkalimarinus coralli]|uniref:type VI secretion system baseplate subunit TssF n=1 Tax=Alkalimarinus coralli TaxID=2935863 RepID=UPI00202B1B60|nr:type VI secretion system baseplate subunit TssF [Alkalimarinus coralli]
MQYSRYFQQELSALRELGREFSELNPRLAPFLSVEGQDPDVERLLEGFAFLTGRIRQKLDDDIPEFAWSLIKLIWPHFLQTVPSITTVEFRPKQIVSERQKLAKGAEVKSIPVDGTSCIFQTANEVDIQPMSVKSVGVTERGGVSTISLNLELFQHVSLKDIAFDDLKFHLHGALPKTSLWYYLLRQRVVNVDIWGVCEGEKVKLGTLEASSIKPGGIEAENSLFASSNQQFLGHRLLLEYFCFPEKFLYLDMKGIGRLIRTFEERDQDNNLAVRNVLVEFNLDHVLPVSDHLSTDNIRLFCSPAVNQFKASTRPFLLDPTKIEHRLSVEAPTPDHYEIMTVDKIEGWSPETREVVCYSSLESFCPGQTKGFKSSPEFKTYWSQQKPSITGKGQETYLSFMSVSQSKASPEKRESIQKSINSLKSETISGQVTCSNRGLPSMLRVGDVCVESSSVPEYLDCSNISSVTPSYSPATKMNWIWRLISHSALNINKLRDLDSLKALISQFDVRGLFDKQQHAATKLKIEGLMSLTTKPSTRLFKGVPVTGNEVEINLASQNFSGIGDIFLFGEILNEFFAASASVNHYHRLTIKALPEGDVMQWEARVGDCLLN